MHTPHTYRHIAFVLLVLAWVCSANAEVPQVINYQGQLTDSLGKTVPDGRYRVQFRVWTTPEGIGFTLWDSGLRDVDVIDGLFEYQLGSAVPLPENLFSADTSRWLGIQIEDNPEMLPRTKITSTAYSYHSLTSDTAEFSRAAPAQVIRESKTVTGSTYASGPNAGTITVSFDSTFTNVPIVFATVVLRGACGSLAPRTVPYWEISVTQQECVLTIFESAGGSLLNGCSVEITYLALQIGS